MLDLRRLRNQRLRERPLGQRLVGILFLGPNYRLPFTRTRIVIEGLEHLRALRRSGTPAILLMNHTDRYNYWPLQYQLWREGLGYTATWVKGKYYENAALGWFMDATNNIPIPSLGYVLSKDFQLLIGRLPNDEEYGALRRLAEERPDGQPNDRPNRIDAEEAAATGGPDVARLISSVWPAVLDIPAAPYLESLRRRFAAMNDRVVALSAEALDMGLFLLIFPEGTRSRRLRPGHSGAAQLLLHTGAAAVPIGCNGSDQCYPGDSPVSRGGTVRYRVGEPISPAEIAALRPDRPFRPLSAEAEPHRERLAALTTRIMGRINALLDPPYQAAAQEDGAEAAGARRFL